MKVKLDADSLKELCLNHVEKVLFAIFVFYVLSILWSSIGIRGFEKKPDDLQSLVRTANANLQKDETKTPSIDDYRTLVKNVAKPVAEESLKTEVVWNPVLFSELKKREQPKTLKIEDLQVTFTRGQVASKDDGDDSLVRSRACIVTGVIPFREQEKAFSNVLANADSSKKRAADEPTYYMYNVQRAEVPDNGDTSNLEWESIRITNGENSQIAKSFSNSSSSDGLYSPPVLMNFPPEKKDKQESQQSASSGDQQDNRGLVAWRSAFLSNSLPPWCKGENTEDIQINYPKAIDLTKTTRETAKTKKATKEADKKEKANEDAASGDETEREEAAESAAAGQDSTGEKKADVRLFQFVDYTVKPGKRYTYRVRIQLHNPNYNFKPTYYVSKEEYTKEKLLPWSEWSDPSPIVETTRDERFMLSNTVALDVNKKKFPYLSLMLIKFEETTGQEITPNFSFISCEPTPLESISRKDKGKTIQQPLGAGQYLLLTETGGSASSDEDGIKSSNKTYDTHFFLLDAEVRTDELYSKGKTLKKEERKNLGDADVIYAPTRVLLMDPDGNITIHSEVVDMEHVYPQLKATTSGGSTEESLLKSADEGKKRGRRGRKAAAEEKDSEPTKEKKPAASEKSKSSELQSSSEQKSHRGSGRRSRNK